jgi:HSP20 family protein
MGQKESKEKGKEKEKSSKALEPVRPSTLLPRWEHEIERMFDEFWRRPFPSLIGAERWWPAPAFRMPAPTLDVYEEKDDVVVKAELPGLSKEDIEVNLTGSTLTIKGEKKKEEEVKEKDYYRRERSYGSFTRSLELPSEVKADQVSASFKNGVLEIRMPKTEEAKKKEIKVKVE